MKLEKQDAKAEIRKLYSNLVISFLSGITQEEINSWYIKADFAHNHLNNTGKYPNNFLQKEANIRDITVDELCRLILSKRDMYTGFVSIVDEWKYKSLKRIEEASEDIHLCLNVCKKDYDLLILEVENYND